MSEKWSIVEKNFKVHLLINVCVLLESKYLNIRKIVGVSILMCRITTIIIIIAVISPGIPTSVQLADKN